MGLSDLFMNANHIAGRGGFFEPQRPNNIYLQIYGLQGAGIRNARGPADLISLSLENFQIPKRGNEVIEVKFLNQRRRVAGAQIIEAITLTVKDFVDQGTRAVMENWHNQVSDAQTGRVGLARDYKKDAHVILLGPNGQFMRRYMVEGLWIQMLDPGDADMQAGSQPTLISATLECDNIYPDGGAWGTTIDRPLAGISVGTIVDTAISVGSSVGGAIGF